MGGGVQRHQKALGRRRGMADQRQIEARRIVRARKLRQIAGRQAAFDDVQCGVIARRRHADHSDDPDGHRGSLRFEDGEFLRVMAAVSRRGGGIEI
jgi:hypothetical protein